MAKKKHRKLFPMLESEKNRTLDCSIGICDSICPYNCYQEPDYYTISPQLTPWSSPQPIRAPSPSISAVNQPSQNPSSSIDAITIITVTGAVLAILLTGLFLVAKYVTASVNRVNHGGRYQSERDGDDDDTVDEEFQDREQVDHPIWLIRTTGLQQSIINSITICNYNRGDGLIERTDCPVCLSEFEEDESLRLLPKCNHAFHISCIDTWLRSHTNCPLCRAGIAISAATPRCSGPVEASPRPRGSGSRLVNDGVGEDLDRGQIENRGDLERESGESGFKERLSSSYRDSEYSDVRIEINGIVDEINRNSEEIDGDGSETETKEQVRVLREFTDPNGSDFVDSLSPTKTHIENVDFPGKSCENQIQGVNRRETEKENRPIEDEASCSEENSEANGEATEVIEKIQSDISSNTSKTIGSSSVSCFNKNKSSIFPL